MTAKWTDNAESGFTLVEMIVVILIIGILATLGGQLVVKPIRGYVDLSRRARLVDQAEMVLRRMQRDIRQALPNSIRIAGGGQFLELIHTVDGGRYRRQGNPADDPLDFVSPDSSFDVLGPLRQTPNAGDALVVYNLTAQGGTGNAYSTAADNRGLVAGGSTATHILLDSPVAFARQSPYQRFFLVDEPITYACESGVLRRYAGYGLAESQPTTFASPGDLLARYVSSCQFLYQSGTAQRAGLVTLRLGLSQDGETIKLLHQVHVVNAP